MANAATRPKPIDVTAAATMLRLGRRLSVSAVDLFSADERVASLAIAVT